MYNNPKLKLGLVFALAFLIAFMYVRETRDIPRDSSHWQAVFLTDGQVYFGKLSNFNTRFALLDQVYYLKFSQGLQQGDLNNVSSQQLNLIKLGGEAHGPENRMYIAKDKILFLENLKDGSSVVQAITNRK